MASTQKQKTASGGSVAGLLSAPTPGSRAAGGFLATLRDYASPSSLSSTLQ
jgi:hypothetical protein